MSEPAPGFYRDPANPSGVRYWTGRAWENLWEPPSGYYRDSAGKVRRWDGHTWGRRYWSWWRIAVTVVLGLAACSIEFVLMGGMVGDPGPGRDTAHFEHVKSLSALLFLVVPLLVAVVFGCLHAPRLSSWRRVRQAINRIQLRDDR